MSQKLLQKKSNRYLQQPLPENLIASKSIGKRGKYRPRRGVVFQNHSRMERNIYNQWLFSWNASTIPRQQEKRFSFQVAIERLKEGIFPRKTIIAPTAHISENRISCAVGGNLVEHLNEFLFSALGQLSDKYKARSLPLNSRKIWYIYNTPYSVLSSKPPGGSSLEKQRASPEVSTQHSTFSGVSYIPFFLGAGAGGEMTTAALICKRIGENICHAIYSLNERARLLTRGDKFSHDYKNQLTERKKIAILYGNLSKKTLVRAMRSAKKMQGNLDSNFFSLLERRLDVALKRACLFPTIRSARHWIVRGKMLVNNQSITVPSYQLQPADIISVTPQAQSTWKKECMQLFVAKKERRVILGNKAVSQSVSSKLTPRFAPKVVLATHSKTSATSFSAPIGPHLVDKIRRFSPSPPLMQKFQEWSAFWSNSPHPFPAHKWRMFYDGNLERFPYSREYIHLYFSTKSALASYLNAKNYLRNSLQSAHRAETAITHTPGRQDLRPPALHTRKRNTPSRHISPYAPIPPQTRWLNQQQGCVVDGLYPYRLNKSFVEKKALTEKIHDWRYSCMKPLHLECSYKLPAAVFLYAPQKLAWPSNINVSLLRKGLLH